MENYFWVAADSHIFVEDKCSGYERPQILDVLALAGPNRLEVDVGEKKITCLVKAMVARAFEIALLLERQNTLHVEGVWLTTAKSLIGELPELTCEICPCPVYPSQHVEDVSGSDFGLSHRIQVDVSDCSSEDITVLQWAFADLTRPVTSLSRTWGSEKYALIGVPDCVPPGSKSIPQGICSSILSLLVRLGVKDLTPMLERAALFVWDVVECAVHIGLGDATVIDLAEKLCKCSVCTEALRGATPETSREQPAETTLHSSPDELIHKWWDSGETARPIEASKLPNCFKLRSRTLVAIQVALPTLESLKLQTVKILAHFQDFRAILMENLRQAGTSPSDANEFSYKVVQREIERTAIHCQGMDKAVPPELLDVISASTSGDLVLRLNTIESIRRYSPSFSKELVKYMVENKSETLEKGWTRERYLRDCFRTNQAARRSTYQLTPCRLFTVPAVGSPVHYRWDCYTCEIETSGEDWRSEVRLSTQGSYGAALWNLVSTKYEWFEFSRQRQSSSTCHELAIEPVVSVKKRFSESAASFRHRRTSIQYVYVPYFVYR